MSTIVAQLQPPATDGQSEKRVPENSIRSAAKTQAMPATQYVINSAPMHAKATTAGLISGGTLHLHRLRSAQVCPVELIPDASRFAS